MNCNPVQAKSPRYFGANILRWYQENGRTFPWRKPNLSDYEKILAEVLLQRTKADTVAEHYGNIVDRYSSWDALANANDADLNQMLRPLGLWRQKSINLKNLAKEVMQLNEILPRRREEIEVLPGVGQYIANAVMLLCHNKREPLLDGNMARVIERFFGPRKLKDIRHDPFLQRLSREIVNCRNPIAMNWAILDFAARVCVARSPKCGQCPVARDCNYIGNQQVLRRVHS